MAKSKLKVALDRFKQKDYAAEKDKKLRKKAEKAKKAKVQQEGGDEESEEEEEEEIPTLIDANATLPESEKAGAEEKEEGSEDEENEEEGSGDDDDEEEEEDEEEEDPEAADDLAFSDIDSDADLQDATPYTRLTINNKPALLATLSKITLPRTPNTIPFSTHLTVTSQAPTEIPDINDDLNRELAIYTQALTAVRLARDLLAKEPNAPPFSRPNDYFAEMVKSDEHMGKIKQKLLDEAADKKASQEAKRQRDLRKFGKKVQVEKLQERQKQKTETLGKIQALKRKRASGDTDFTTTEPDMFDVALDNSLAAPGAKRGKNSTGGHNPKRQKKNEKFGFGGKAKHNKRNDSESAGDIGGFSVRANKARQFGNAKKAGGGAKKRLGKSVRKAKK